MRKALVSLFVLGVIALSSNAQPDSLWNRTYGGTHVDAAYSVQKTSDGGYVLAGYTMSFSGGTPDFWLVKTNANGDSLWSRRYGGRGSDICLAVQQTSDGGYALAGHPSSVGTS